MTDLCLNQHNILRKNDFLHDKHKVFLSLTESHSVQVEQKEKYYEVVRPVRLHTVRKRDAEVRSPI